MCQIEFRGKEKAENDDDPTEMVKADVREYKSEQVKLYRKMKA